MRKIKRNLYKNQYINPAKILILTGLSFSLLTGMTAMAQQIKPTSGNLPVPNYVNGANFTYNLTAVTVGPNTNQLDTNTQQSCASAANVSNYLDIDLGKLPEMWLI